jgi:DNA-binding transcriptional ArsR family regulator
MNKGLGKAAYAGRKRAKTRVGTLPEVLAALGDPLRLKILRSLETAGEKSCGQFGIEMPKSSLSHHFKVLRDAGLIVSWPEGRETINRLNLEAVENKFPGVLKAVLRA